MSIVIIGSGFSGLCMAIKLKQAGIEDFVILERGADIGGTWRDNTYPGCACDVQSHVYSFSFEPNPDWTRMFAPQPEIFAYLKRVADKYGIRPHVRFNENVRSAHFDEARAEWTIVTNQERTYKAKVLVSGIGALSNPAIPSLKGIERFKGRAFHSAKWDHSFDVKGKRVAVIGTGASAIQFVPQIAPEVAKLYLFQRTPPWVMPKPDRHIGAREQATFRRVPLAQKLMRGAIYSKLEGRVFAFQVAPSIMKVGGKLAKWHIDSQITSPELRAKVTPDYTMGCKRVLLSNDYYPSLNLPQVDVLTEGVKEVREHSVVIDDGGDGRELEVDAIIYGTGFKVQEVVPRGLFHGRGGKDLADEWKTGVEAYKGTTVAGFPNLFIILGPNTGLGHNSMVYMIESQVAYVMDAVTRMRAEGWTTLDVRRDEQTMYNDGLQKELGKAVWQAGCKSWYLDENGKNTALWPTFTFSFRKQTERFDAEAYVVEKAAVGQKATRQEPSTLVAVPSTDESAQPARQEVA